jgi:2-dehydro-3-deoxyphosphogluconate aldolase/(4S)-4-hydroxy-2-oxoglutarate aldolase
VILSEALDRVPVVAILRAGSAERFGDVARVIVEQGIGAVELTLTTPGALDALRSLRDCDLPGLALGAGTVTTAAQLADAADAGATYVVTPALVPEVLAAGAERGVPVLCGAFTATEALAAHRGGASMVKLFPASLGGPAYLAALRQPLPDVPFVPTGGVHLDDVPAWFASGAVAVAVGGPLVGDACTLGGDLAALAERARGFASAAVRP